MQKILIAVLLMACAPNIRAGEAAATKWQPEFFPFCIDTHDARKRSLEDQARMLKELGFDGVGHLWLDNIPERLKTLDAAGLRLYQITINMDITPGKPAWDARLKEVLPLLKGRRVQFDLLIRGAAPSDPAADERAVTVLRELSDLGRDSGAEFLLYPHTGDWMQTIQDATRVAAKVNRPNVGVMFNLCHYLRVSPDREYQPLLKQALPWLRAVSINGADDWDPSAGWNHYIQPLGEGSFDVLGLLRHLEQVGYRGTVGLQCYGIPGDVREHLERSMRAWRQYRGQLN